MKAYPADSLVESVGVNIHLHFNERNPDTNTINAYNNFEGKVIPSLEYLGVRYVRDGFPAYKAITRDAFFYQRVRALATKGIKFDMTVALVRGGNPETDMSKLSQYLEWSGGGVVSIEGVNEPDDKDLPTVRRLQEALWKAVKSQRLPVSVLAPSIISNNAGLGDVGQWCDFGNMHSYPGSGKPSGPLDGDVKTKSVCWPGKPIQITECSYHNASKHTGGHRPASEETAGVYTPILLLEHFRRNFTRSYIYETLDQHPNPDKTNKELNFGLFRYDASPKPAATALQRLIALHADPGKPFTPKDLELNVKGPDSVRSLLFQKSDGTYLLDLWRDVEVGTKAAEVTVRVPPVSGYKLHRFTEGDVVEKTFGSVASKDVWDVSYTFDPMTGKQEGYTSTKRTLKVSTGGVGSEVVLPVGAGLMTLEIGGM